MADLVIPCFVEDDGHRSFLDALLRRLAGEEGWPAIAIYPDFRSSTKGRGEAMTSLRSYLGDVRRGRAIASPLLVILLDGNCTRSQERKRQVLEVAERYGLAGDQVVVGVPDPHIERWFLDGPALKKGVGPEAEVHAPHYKCERQRYKIALRDAFKPTGIAPLAGGVEYASDIVPHLALDPPVCGDEALKDFANELRAALRRLRAAR